MALLGAVLNFAVSRDYLAAHPFKGLAQPKVKRKRARYYRHDELARLSAHPIFTNGERPRSGGGDALLWLPLMSLYLGARLGELVRLKVADFHEAPGAGPFFEIHEWDEGASTKTEESDREVPVHPELVRLGLMHYVESLRDAGEVYLFPKLKTRKNGDRSGAIGHAFSRLLDKVELPDPSLKFHTFRHTFITYARESGIGDDVRRVITGHEGGDVHSGYGGHTAQERADAMRRYTVPGLDLSAVRCTPQRCSTDQH